MDGTCYIEFIHSVSSISDYADLIIKVEANNHDLEYQGKRTEST
jgi:hypothetical protein